mgnify:CR=1 FL=1
MRVTIDRFEGNYAVCETDSREMINLDRHTLPPDAREGDILLIEDNKISIDKTATSNQKNKIDKLMNDLWK